MASKREQLLARKKANDAKKARELKTSTAQKTLVDVFVEDLNNHSEKNLSQEAEKVKEEPIISQKTEVKEIPSQEEDKGVTKIQEGTIEEVSSINNQEEPIKKEEIVENESNLVSQVVPEQIEKEVDEIQQETSDIKSNEIINKASEITTEDITASEKIENKILSITPAEAVTIEDKTSRKAKNADSEINWEKYAGKDITITLTMSEEVNEFFTFRPIELQKPAKTFFKELMIKEIENGVIPNDELAKKYQKTQHDTVKRTVQITEVLKQEIKSTAAKYHMRYTTFMAYVLDKERINSNW